VGAEPERAHTKVRPYRREDAALKRAATGAGESFVRKSKRLAHAQWHGGAVLWNELKRATRPWTVGARRPKQKALGHMISGNGTHSGILSQVPIPHSTGE